MPHAVALRDFEVTSGCGVWGRYTCTYTVSLAVVSVANRGGQRDTARYHHLFITLSRQPGYTTTYMRARVRTSRPSHWLGNATNGVAAHQCSPEVDHRSTELQ